MQLTAPAFTATALAALLFSAHAVAAPLATTRTHVSSSISFYDGSANVVDLKEYSGNGPMAAQSAGGAVGVHAQSAASVDVGVLKSSARLVNSQDFSWASAMSGGQWEQQVTFVNPDLTGQTGRTTLQHYYSATMQRNGPNATFFSGIGLAKGPLSLEYTDFVDTAVMRTVELSPSGLVDVERYSFGGPEQKDLVDYYHFDQKPNAAPQDYLYLPVEFIWGETYTILSWQMSMCMGLNFPGAALDCAVDASHSSYWAGLGQVFDAAGNVVTNFQLQTADGADFSQSLVPAQVPEPAAPALLLLGLGAAAVARRRSLHPRA